MCQLSSTWPLAHQTSLPQGDGYTNYKKADWVEFTAQTERDFAARPLDPNLHSASKIFAETLRAAARRCVPRGRMKNFIPWLPASAIILIRQRNALRTVDPTDPQVAALNLQIDREIRESKQAHWRAKVEKLNTNADLGGLWKLAKALTTDTSQSAAPNRKLTFPFRTGDCLVAAAKGFNRLFNSAAPNPPLQPLISRSIRRRLRPSGDCNSRFQKFACRGT